MIDLLDMKIIVAVAETLNFSKAAKKLYLTQPAVSKKVHKIEHTYGISLFKREYHNLQMTNEGQIFYKYARKELELHKQLIDELNTNQLEGIQDQQLKIGLFITKGIDPYIKKFTYFAKEHPNVRIEFNNVLSSKMIEEVSKNKLDLGIGIIYPYRNISWYKLFNDEFVIVRDRNKYQTNKIGDLADKTLLTMPDELKSPSISKLINGKNQIALNGVDEIITNLMVLDSYAILSKNLVSNLNNPHIAFNKIKDLPRNSTKFATGLAYRSDNGSKILASLLRSFR